MNIHELTQSDMTVIRREPDSEDTNVELPHLFTPRPYQRPLWQAMVNDDCKRAAVIWHRRAGKDKTYFQIMVAKTQQRVGAYWYMLPKSSQARKVIWQGRGKENVVDGEQGGISFLDHIPAPLVRKVNSSEMYIEFWNGSILYVMGSDNYDNYVGSNPLGVIFSEWALCDPQAWDFIRPILAENDGWAMFCYTPRGRNHGHTLFKIAQRNRDRWMLSVLTAKDTLDVGGNRIITDEMIEMERDDGMSEDMIDQEFFCSFDAAQPGVIFAKDMKKARAEHRITSIPVEPLVPVHTFWDWGIADDTSVWLVQIIGKERRVIGFYSNNNEKLEHYLTWCNNFKDAHEGMIWGSHIGPHDTGTRDLKTGKTIQQVAKPLGFEFQIMPRPTRKKISIDALRRIMPTIWFDEARCNKHHGIDALETYHYEYNVKTKAFSTDPKHDWSSNSADALQQMGLWISNIEDSIRRKADDQERRATRTQGAGGWHGG